MNVWKSRSESNDLNSDNVNCEAYELDESLSRFFVKIRKDHGSDYEPYSNSNLQNSSPPF